MNLVSPLSLLLDQLPYKSVLQIELTSRGREATVTYIRMYIRNVFNILLAGFQ
jgi:hypothetical protein